MKKMFLFAATAAIALSSCSKNEVMEIATPNDNPYTIGFSTGMFTTKGAPMTESVLQGKTVKVLIDSKTNADITPEFSYSAPDWGQNTHKWSAVDFPADVYSLQDNSGAIGTLASATKGATVAVDYAVTEANVTAHKDLIYFGSQLASQPTSNNISAVFKHALSRAYISAKYDGCKIYIASASLVNMNANGTIAIKNNNSITWSNADDDVLGDYNYLTYTAGNTVAETTQKSPLSDIDTHDMYVIPQTTVATANVNAINQTTETFIKFIYRVETANGDSAIGYKDLADVQSTDKNATITSGDASKGIFIVGYVAVDAKALAEGSYYNLLVDLGTKAIRYAEATFVGPDGTAIVIDSKAVTAPVLNDPVNPDADEYIGLTVVEIENWPGTTDQDL